MLSMKIENANIDEIILKATEALKQEKNISPSFIAIFEVVLFTMKLMCDRLLLNSSNSSIPPSRDPNRPRKQRTVLGKKRKQGGQEGHVGSTLQKVETPDIIEDLFIDKTTLPKGHYKKVGYEARQVFDIKITTHVKEYRAEILEDDNGKQYVADFPEEVSRAAQYGNEVKVQSVYMSVFQLIPLARVADYFKDQMGLPLSKGSISNFNKETAAQLDLFEKWARQELLNSPFNHADETGININGKKAWLHNLSNALVTLYHPDVKRGKEGMDRMGILPDYHGVLCHDHWASYYSYACLHALCNAHHLRELTFAYEEDGQKWAKEMHDFLIKLNNEVKKSEENCLSKIKIENRLATYREILTRGDKECVAPVKTDNIKGRLKKSKSRNLLERLMKFEDETLRFMKEDVVSFTNNQGENDLRMTKVHQKVSGCFRSMEGAQIFCRIRGYLVTCRKNGVSPTDALRLLFQGKLPDFIKIKSD